jgi:hypothetical protein
LLGRVYMGKLSATVVALVVLGSGVAVGCGQSEEEKREQAQ